MAENPPTGRRAEDFRQAIQSNTLLFARFLVK
jgi:hypothetical protein